MPRSIRLLCVSAFLLLCILHVVSSLDCESCGKECKQICGTKRFRNCCYNYIKKRSSSVTSGYGGHLELITVDPGTSAYYPAFKYFMGGHEEVYRPRIYREGTDSK